MKDNLMNATSSTDWDGSTKSFTELCMGCEFYKRVNNEDRCYWGIAYKVMDKSKILSYCQLKSRLSPRKERLSELELAK